MLRLFQNGNHYAENVPYPIPKNNDSAGSQGLRSLDVISGKSQKPLVQIDKVGGDIVVPVDVLSAHLTLHLNKVRQLLLALKGP